MTVVIPGVGIVSVPWYMILLACVAAAAIIGVIVTLVRSVFGKR